MVYRCWGTLGCLKIRIFLKDFRSFSIVSYPFFGRFFCDFCVCQLICSRNKNPFWGDQKQAILQYFLGAFKVIKLDFD
jgi:hypothetical protein